MKIGRVLDALVLPIAKLLEPREHVLPDGGVNLAVGFGIGMRKDGSPSLLSQGVARHCVMLYKAGMAKKILFSGGSEGGGVTEASAMKSVALAMGVRDEDALVEEYSRNTHSNALNVVRMVKGIASQQRDTPACISIATVGQSLHARRCYACLKKVAPKNWAIFRLKATCHYDSFCTQRRLSAEWKFLPWELVWTVLFKILRWT